LIAGVVAGFRYYVRAQSSSAGMPRPTAEQLLAQRFVRGEIDEQEYQRRAEMLRGSMRSASAS
jgi:putative membrane protein